MPAFTALAAFVARTLISAGLPSILASVGGNLVAGVTAAFLSAQFTRRPSLSAPTANYQAVINQSAAPRVRGYGRAKLGGPRAFFDSKNGRLYQVILFHTGEIDGFERIWIGDIAVTTDAAGRVQQAPFYVDPTFSWVRMTTRLGTATQTVLPEMHAAWGSTWGANHRLDGIACLEARFVAPKLEDFQAVYPDSYQTQIRAECRLSKVHDPRTDRTVWSDNAGLCIADYLAADDGMPGIAFDDVDWDTVATFANICAQGVPQADGGMARRYLLWGVYSLQDEPKSVLERMSRTCDAELYLTSAGKIGIRGGQWSDPTVTIGDEIITGYDGLEEGSGRFVAFNELQIIYTDPNQDYQPTEAEPWIDLADQAVRGQVRDDFDVDMVPSASQARRLAKIHSAKANPRWRGTVHTDLRGLAAVGDRIIRLVITELGIDDTFLVQGWSISSDLRGCSFDLVALDASAYSWDASLEEGQTPPPPTDTTPDMTLPVPVFSGYTAELRVFTGGASAPVILAEYVAEASRDDLTLRAQARLSPDGPWESMSIDDLTAISGPVTNGEEYDLQARWVTPSDAAGDWSEPETILVSV